MKKRANKRPLTRRERARAVLQATAQPVPPTDWQQIALSALQQRDDAIETVNRYANFTKLIENLDTAMTRLVKATQAMQAAAEAMENEE